MIDIPDSIYPKDKDGRSICPRCKKIVASCDCPTLIPVKPKGPSLKPVIRLDKSGRKGKTVTVISGLPRDEEYLKNLSKTFKVKTGSGGTFYSAGESGIIEIQGDQRKVIEQILSQEGCS